jgi:uncharacterized protein (DUF1501 family)
MVTLDRRDFLGVAAGAFSGFFGLRAALAAAGRTVAANGKRLIVLWMEGGPSQIDTFDPKPGTAHGGPFSALATAASGIRIAEHLPLVAKEMKSISIIRTMTSKEGNHPRARHLLHTGYPPGGAVHHPGLGSVVAHEIGSAESPLPAFVSIGGLPVGSGFLGPQFAPYLVPDPGKSQSNLRPPKDIDDARLERRLSLLDALDAGFAKRAPEHASAHAVMRERALRMMRSDEVRAFDISEEPSGVRAAYGDTPFGRGSLAARRLVESGVRAVEVALKGWDTHEDNFDRVRTLSRELDPAMSALIGDLRRRGLLEDTLVVWMGEFGRTPAVNGKNGRDHYPRAYSVALAGCGVRGGTVVGETSADGMEVRDRPVTVPELFATIYRCLGLDLGRTFATPQGRPIPIVAEGAKPIAELV